ncbi:MAG: hypothetical protein U0103_23135 [Candidatus Obscuribacterales bacterium]
MKNLAHKVRRLEQEIIVEQWQYPKGTPVSVCLSDGRLVQTATRSRPRITSNRAVIFLEGFARFVPLDRCMVPPKTGRLS